MLGCDIMLKKFKKKSLKSKIAIISVILILLLLIVYVVYEQFKPEPPVSYEMATVAKGTIVDSLEVSGTVQSGYSHNYVAIRGVRAEEVSVSVGDEVKKGDLIATFDVSGAAEYLVSAKKDYDSALKDYNNALSSVNKVAANKAQNKKDINSKNAEITAKKAEIAALEKQIAEQGQTVTEEPIPQEQIDAIVSSMRDNGASQEEIDAFLEGASSVKVPSVSGDTSLQQELIQKNLELSQLNAELTALQASGALNVSTDNDSYLDALKNIADSKKQAYDSIKSVYDELKKGWYADKDGIITKVNVKPGEVFVPVEENTDSLNIGSLFGSTEYSDVLSSLIGSSKDSSVGTGITLDSYDDIIVSVTVGKSDLLKLKTGMKATVSSLEKVYDAEIIYVGATAVESSGLDIGSITSSLIGGSGSSNGALVELKIKEPDKNLVIGFDADVKIALTTLPDVLKIPVEAVVYDNGSYYVFVYDKAKGVVEKRDIAHGVLDDTSYQIIDGLKEGEIVIKSPDPNTVDGTKVAEKKA